jgi:hypothetical protein
LAQEKEGQEPENIEKIENGDVSDHNLEEIDGDNWYRYGDNNPIINIDPDGLAKKSSGKKDNPATKVNETSVANGMANAINASKLYGLGELLVFVPVPGARALATGCYVVGGVLTAFSAVDTLCGFSGTPGPSEYVGNVLNALGDSLP